MNMLSHVSTASLAVGAVGAIVGTVLLIVGADDETVSVGGGGLTLRF